MIFLPCGKPRGKRNNLIMRKLKGNPSQLHPNIKCQPNVICIPYADKQVKHTTGFWLRWILDRSFQNKEISKFQDILFQHCHIKNKQKKKTEEKNSDRSVVIILLSKFKIQSNSIDSNSIFSWVIPQFLSPPSAKSLLHVSTLNPCPTSTASLKFYHHLYFLVSSILRKFSHSPTKSW